MRRIKLTQGKEALVDDEDYDYLNQWKWCVHKGGSTNYAKRAVVVEGKHITVLMHRVLDPGHPEVDHVDGNGFNNQKENLRGCTAGQNHCNQKKHSNNKSGYKGVYWNRKNKKWIGCIRFNKKSKHLGSFTNKIDAARAYDKAALELHGEFASLNFPKE